MRPLTSMLLSVFLLLAFAPGAARSEVPQFMHFQGVLTDDAGLPVTDTVNMTFSLYADTTGVPVWTAQEPGLSVVNGFYEAVLEVGGLPFDVPYFLGIVVDGTALGPKKPLATVPYSFRSGRTKVVAGAGLAGEGDTAFVTLSIDESGVVTEFLADSAVTEPKIGRGAVTAEKIAAGSVVKSINGLRDNVILEAGTQISITEQDSVIHISASVSGEAADDDWEVAGDDVYSIPPGNVGIGTGMPGTKLDVAGGSIRTDDQLISTVPDGTPPLSVGSMTHVANLNADMVDGLHAGDLAPSVHPHDAGAITSGTIAFGRLPVGSDADEVAAGNHSHSGADVDDQDWVVSGSDLYPFVGGNVGIGTTSPGRKLDVNGEAAFAGALYARGGGGIGLKDSNGALGLWVADGGKIGIGTESPDTDVHIRGDSVRKFRIESTDGVSTDAFVSAELKTAGGDFDILQMMKFGPAAGGAWAGVPMAGLGMLSSGVNASGMMLRTGGATPIHFVTNDAYRMILDGSGNVGLGTASPSRRLSIAAGGSGDGVDINNTALLGDPELRFLLSGTPKFTIGVDDSDADKLKIGTSSVGTGTFFEMLDDGKATFMPTGVGQSFVVANENFNTTQMVNFESGDSVFMNADVLQIKVDACSGSSQFIECEDGSGVKFKVNGSGDVYADGAFTGPADFSEMIAVSSGSASAEPGDVMVIDPSSPRSAVRSYEARSTLVAGVYSTRPGFLGSERDWDVPTAKQGDEGDTYTLEAMAEQFNEVPLAVVGIVPCKVSAENGAIRPGDLLVTAGTPGHAMRDGDPKTGTVLGKALGSLPSGTGTIRVLVTLQ